MDSKSIVRFVRPWVQIPPAAPQKACNQVDFRLFSFSQVLKNQTLQKSSKFHICRVSAGEFALFDKRFYTCYTYRV